MRAMPPAEVTIDEDLVRGLLRSQAPDVADLPLERVGRHGWDNAVFRLGRTLAVRLPRRAAAAPLIEHEVQWLPDLAGSLPLPVPVPVFAGRPALGYPWSWAVCRWVPGEPLGLRPVRSVDRLLAFLDALHVLAPADAPQNAFRGVPLGQRDARLRQGCEVLAEHGVEVAPILRAWDQTAETQPYQGQPLWLHGDLHAANVLVTGGGISGVIDFGDLTSGDPACDYLLAWMLPPEQRAELRAAAQRHGPGTWQRSRGWALAWGVAALSAGADTPMLRDLGRRATSAAAEIP